MKIIARDVSLPNPGSFKITNRNQRVTVFARQLAVLFSTGIPLSRSLDILTDQSDDPAFAQVLTEVTVMVNSGHLFSAALGRFARVFPSVMVHLVQVGENTGGLGISLSRVADILEKDSNVLRRVKSALSYPIFILSLTLILTLCVFYFVLPNFIGIFVSLKTPLPLITQLLIFITQALRSPGWWLVATGLAQLSYSWVSKSWNVPTGRVRIYSFLLSLPLIGSILLYSTIARYCWVFGVTMESGMELTKSLRLASLASGSPALEADGARIIESVINGAPLHKHYRENPNVYPRVLAHMVLAAEESSTLSPTLARLGDMFDEDLLYRLELFNAALEPVLISLMALVVGSVVVAIFLPLYGTIGDLGH